MERTHQLQEGVRGLLKAVQSGDLPKRADPAAMKLLAMVHDFLQRPPGVLAVADAIDAELAKFALKCLNESGEMPSAAVAAFSRTKVIKVIHSLNTAAKVKFINNIAEDIGWASTRADVTALNGNIAELLSALPAPQDREVSEAVSKLAEKCLVNYYPKLDGRTREACLQVFPLTAIEKMICDPETDVKQALTGEHLDAVRESLESNTDYLTQEQRQAVTPILDRLAIWIGS